MLHWAWRLFSLSKHVRTNLPLISGYFDFCPSLPFSCYSQTCPSACLAICTFPGCSGAEGPRLLQGVLHYQHLKYLFWFSPILMPFVLPPCILNLPWCCLSLSVIFQSMISFGEFLNLGIWKFTISDRSVQPFLGGTWLSFVLSYIINM